MGGRLRNGSSARWLMWTWRRWGGEGTWVREAGDVGGWEVGVDWLSVFVLSLLHEKTWRLIEREGH